MLYYVNYTILCYTILCYTILYYIALARAAGGDAPPPRHDPSPFSGGTTCLRLLVLCGLICFTCFSSCQGSPSSATLLATFEESCVRQVALDQVVPPNLPSSRPHPFLCPRFSNAAPSARPSSPAVRSNASAQWQPDGLTVHTKKWLLGA